MKEKLFNIAKYLIFVVAIAQLALSQIQIDIITKVFNPAVGFYLFLFTIFGVLMAFNSSNYKHGSKMLLFILGSVATLITGLLYLSVIFKDVADGNLLTFADVNLGVIISIISISVYTICSVTMIFSGNYND